MHHAFAHNYRNCSFIVDVAMGQIPSSTVVLVVALLLRPLQNFSDDDDDERISSFRNVKL